MPLVLKWQGNRKFCLNCILEIWYFDYALGSQHTKILHILEILISWSFTGYVERLLNIPRVPNML